MKLSQWIVTIQFITLIRRFGNRSGPDPYPCQYPCHLDRLIRVSPFFFATHQYDGVGSELAYFDRAASR